MQLTRKIQRPFSKPSATPAQQDTRSRAQHLEDSTQQLGKNLLTALRKHGRGGIAESLYAQMLKLSTSDEKLKVELFRFVDVLPTLKTPEAVMQHLTEYLRQPGVKLPAGGGKLLNLAQKLPGGERLSERAVQFGVQTMSQRFIAGKNADEVTSKLLVLRRNNMAFTLDLLGEAVISESEALTYQQKYLDIITALTERARGWSPNVQIDRVTWEKPQTSEVLKTSEVCTIPRVNASVKLSSLYARFDPMAADATAEAVKARLRPILRLARERGAQIHIDMEQYDYRDITRRIFVEIINEPEFRDWADIGIVVQAYLRDSESDLQMLLTCAKARGTPFWIRLVKGAYWDYETMLAAQRDYESPVFAEKWQTDANYEHLTAFLIANYQHLRPAIASHNVRSVAHAQAIAQQLGVPKGAVEYQVLYGMGEAMGRALSAQGQRVRVYVPFGELLPGMAYLVRRLLENTSNDSFVKQVELDHKAAQALLAPPARRDASGMRLKNAPQTDAPPRDAPPARLYRNNPLLDFAKAGNQTQMQTALAQVQAHLGMRVPVVIGGEREAGEQLVARENPSNRSQTVCQVDYASMEQAQRAVALAERLLPVWREVSVRERADLLRRVAAEFERRRHEINAWMVLEVGKPWREADGDLAEAIDFCTYYADEMERLAQPRKRNVPGEWNDYAYDARGVAVVIAPWNFPLAILTGMTVAALVAGNPVVIKPAEQSSRVGYFLMEALEAAGLPKGVANFVPGEGETVGAALVADPRVAVINFTGSKAVGLHIMKEAADIKPGQREIKHVVAELGGKNAMIVDSDADLDEAVLGVLHSLIGFGGQKCSACSRVIVIGDNYDAFCARLKEAIHSVKIGPADDPATTLGPLVDAASQTRINRYIEIGEQEGRLFAAITPSAELTAQGHYVPAAVFTECAPHGRLCQEGIFGPGGAGVR
nr:proline dehydrogenase family protein [Anaerolineae bacterium]